MSESFILNFRHSLTADECTSLISRFDQSNQHHPGRTGSGVDTAKKNSLDLAVSSLDEWKTICARLNDLVMDCVTTYVQTFPHLITGAVTPHIMDPDSGAPRAIRFDEVARLKHENIRKIVDSMLTVDPWNLQRYEPRSGGYPHWHSEQFPSPNDPMQRALHRVLLVIIYLNDVSDAGATEFFYQQAAIQPEAGSVVLAPCGFTHTHRGAPSPTQAKYILASWVSYKDASQLYNT